MRVRQVLAISVLAVSTLATNSYATIAFTVTDFEVGIPYLDPIGAEYTPCSADNYSRRIDWHDGGGFKIYKTTAMAVNCGQGIWCVRPGHYATLNQDTSGQTHVFSKPGTLTANAELTVHCIGATWTATDRASAEVHVYERHPINQLTAPPTAKRGSSLKGQVTLTSQAEGLGTTVDFSVDKVGVFDEFQNGKTLRLYRIVPTGGHQGNFTFTVKATAPLGPVVLKAMTVGQPQQVKITIVR